VTLATGDSASGIEYFNGLSTGSGSDTISFTTRRDNTINTGAGNDTINAGLGYDTVDGGDGNDTLTVNYSTAGSTGNGIYSSYNSGTDGYFQTYNGTSNDTISFSNIEQLNVTGTAFDDTIHVGSGNDTVNSGAGNDAIYDYYGGSNLLNGGDGNDTYGFYSYTSGGTQIQDTSGSDTLNLYDIDLTLADPAAGTYGMQRANNALIIDVNGDGVVSASTDLSIQNFFSTGGAGTGFIETVDNVSGSAILAAYGSAPTNTVTGTAANENFVTTNITDVIDAAGGTDKVTSTVDNLKQSDNITGGTGTDTFVVTGGSSADNFTLTLATSANQLAGIAGITISYFEKFDFSTYQGTLNATGSTAADSIVAGKGNDNLSGGAGNDTLNGGIGVDTMDGGAGNDIYVVDNVGDVVTGEVSGGGTDTVQSSLSYDLGTLANVENLTLTGTGIINGTGNALNNTITGNSKVNTLTGLDGNDTLNGGVGADTMDGGAGNDIYVVDNVGDVVTGEVSGGGTDTVQSSLSYDLGTLANVENLTLTGTGIINGTGNALNNTITGNSKANTLTGLDGNDTLNGGAGDDTLNGGAGDDTYVFNTSTSQGSDSIADSSGNNTLDFSGSQPVTIDLSNTSAQTVNTNLTLTITPVTQVKTVNGSSLADTITGNDSSNSLNGKDGNDALSGGGGDDKLTGAKGNDTLMGGTGSDQFIFDTGAAFSATAIGLDTITDFVVGTDKIVLDKTTFTALTSAVGNITASEFAVINSTTSGSTLAGNSTAKIVFNQATGDLYYNSNGATAGLGTGSLFTKLTGVTALAATDVLVQA
jgi:Ca2+-binding RTX toxin-like protein